VTFERDSHMYIIYQGTDILPEIFSSSPDLRVFVARKFWTTNTSVGLQEKISGDIQVSQSCDKDP
jgi:hypothetical protein